MYVIVENVFEFPSRLHIGINVFGPYESLDETKSKAEEWDELRQQSFVGHVEVTIHELRPIPTDVTMEVVK